MLELLAKRARPERFKGFSARSGRRVNHGSWEKLWSLYGINFDENISSVFTCKQELVLEIGFGNGVNLVNQAKLNPEVNYIGIELYKAGVYNLLRQVAREKLENIRIFFGQAAYCLPHVMDYSLRKIEIFFPDPWPKRRQQKRRLINQEFIELIAKKLTPGGILHIATDCLEYGHAVLGLLESHKGFTNLYPEEKYAPRNQVARIITKFEARALEQNATILDLMFLSNT